MLQVCRQLSGFEPFPYNTGLCGGSDRESCTGYMNTGRVLFLDLALVAQTCSICENSARCTFILGEFVFSLNKKFHLRKPNKQKLGLDDIPVG